MKKQPLRLALEQIGNAHHETAALLAEQNEINDELIHFLRVCSKRLRAFWTLVEPIAGAELSKQASEDLRAAAAEFGAARDHHVMLNLLKELISKAKRDKKLAALNAVHTAWNNHLPVAENERIGVDELRRIWDRDRYRWAQLSATELSDREAAQLIRRGFKILYKKSRKLYRRAVAEQDMVQWHSLRKWIKYISLTLPICGNDPVRGELTTEYVRLGKRLGKLHDFDELINAIGQMNTDQVDQQQSARVIKLLSRKRDSLRVACDLDARRLLESRPAAFVNRLLQPTA
jgi:hypothetical protein